MGRLLAFFVTVLACTAVRDDSEDELTTLEETQRLNVQYMVYNVEFSSSYLPKPMDTVRPPVFEDAAALCNTGFYIADYLRRFDTDSTPFLVQVAEASPDIHQWVLFWYAFDKLRPDHDKVATDRDAASDGGALTMAKVIFFGRNKWPTLAEAQRLCTCRKGGVCGVRTPLFSKQGKMSRGDAETHEPIPPANKEEFRGDDWTLQSSNDFFEERIGFIVGSCGRDSKIVYFPVQAMRLLSMSEADVRDKILPKAEFHELVESGPLRKVPIPDQEPASNASRPRMVLEEQTINSYSGHVLYWCTLDKTFKHRVALAASFEVQLGDGRVAHLPTVTAASDHGNHHQDGHFQRHILHVLVHTHMQHSPAVPVVGLWFGDFNNHFDSNNEPTEACEILPQIPPGGFKPADCSKQDARTVHDSISMWASQFTELREELNSAHELEATAADYRGKGGSTCCCPMMTPMGLRVEHAAAGPVPKRRWVGANCAGLSPTQLAKFPDKQMFFTDHDAAFDMANRPDGACLWIHNALVQGSGTNDNWNHFVPNLYWDDDWQNKYKSPPEMRLLAWKTAQDKPPNSPWGLGPNPKPHPTWPEWGFKLTEPPRLLEALYSKLSSRRKPSNSTLQRYRTTSGAKPTYRDHALHFMACQSSSIAATNMNPDSAFPVWLTEEQFYEADQFVFDRMIAVHVKNGQQAGAEIVRVSDVKVTARVGMPAAPASDHFPLLGKVAAMIS